MIRELREYPPMNIDDEDEGGDIDEGLSNTNRGDEDDQ
jgi:hypothetical protein